MQKKIYYNVLLKQRVIYPNKTQEIFKMYLNIQNYNK